MTTRLQDDELDPELRAAQAERSNQLRNLAIGIVVAVGVAGIVLAILYL